MYPYEETAQGKGRSHQKGLERIVPKVHEGQKIVHVLNSYSGKLHNSWSNRAL